MAENPYFFKVFKDYTGTTPRQYRNLCEQKQ
jgi:YesN/AraC family two-component response regulator